MGFFDGIRGIMSGGREVDERWKVPGSEQDVDSLFTSDSGINLVYKHSFSCGVCVFTKTAVEAIIDDYSPDVSFHFVDVIQNRSLSQYLAKKSGVIHQSPQLILLNNGNLFWHASHGGIREDVVRETVDELV